MIYIALKSSHVAVLAALVLFLSLSTPSPTSATTSKPPPPHIVYILADDFGWRYADWHRKDLVNQSITPTLQKLVDQGVELDRLYAFKFCSPSRSAIQTGRNPISVNVQNVKPEVSNPGDDVGGWQGIPTEMTGLATLLKESANYSTHIVGKWDVGMATSRHHPRARGYDSWTGYWHHSNDYWQHTEQKCSGKNVFDLWRYNETFDGPALEFANGKSCSQKNQAPDNETCVYEEELLTDFVVDVINKHDKKYPLFLFWSMHLVHYPLQVPVAYEQRFAGVEDDERRKMLAMTSFLDHDVSRVVDVLEESEMIDDTLIIFHADNGGEIMGAGICGGNNWPLRGGKFSNFEGGIRVNGFVSGGYVPKQVRGTKTEALMTIWDWYATLAQGLAGAEDITDRRAADAGLPPHDSRNLWPFLSGQTSTPPRDEIVVGETTSLLPNGDGKTLVGGIIKGKYKLLVGAADRLHTISQNTLTGPAWPNSSSHLVPLSHLKTCGRTSKHGCLFDIFADPTESHNLAPSNDALFNSMLERLDALQANTSFVYSPVRGKTDKRACESVSSKYQGYWGPFVHD